MKKVIFLCLLSLSVCLSKPAENPAVPIPPANNATKVPAATEQLPITQATVNKTVTTNSTEETTNKGQPTQIPIESTEKDKVNPPAQTAAAPSTSTKPAAETPKPANDNKTTTKDEVVKPKDVTDTTTGATDPKAPAEKASSDEGKDKTGTKPENKDVTPKPTETTKTTEAPKSDKDAHIVQARGFDGPSFIGGIILALGLLAIGFMGFKYYKNQTERNYHTL